MGLAAKFEDIVHRELKVHAAWMPITIPYELGDYGIISDGVFQKLGNIKEEFNVSFSQKAGQNATLNFISESTTAIDVGTSAEVNLNPQGELKANVKYKFDREDSFLIKAPVINVSQIQSVNLVAQQLKQARGSGWQKKFIVVHQVYTAENPMIVAAQEGGTEVEIGADAGALKQFNVGSASANFSLKTTKGRAFDITGQTGPIALGLFKIHWLTGDTQLLNLDDEVEVVDLNEKELSDDM